MNFENVKKRNVDLLIKKIELNCCNHDIIIKICNIKNLDEFFVEKIKIDCVASLKPENNDIKPQVENNENLALEIEKLKKERVCVVCMDNLKNITFLPCAHLGKIFFLFKCEIILN